MDISATLLWCCVSLRNYVVIDAQNVVVGQNEMHSYYYRTVEDVPMYGAKVVLRIRARKFFCHNPECPRTIFTEHFDGFLAESQRKTTRLNELLTQIGFALVATPEHRLPTPRRIGGKERY